MKKEKNIDINAEVTEKENEVIEVVNEESKKAATEEKKQVKKTKTAKCW